MLVSERMWVQIPGLSFTVELFSHIYSAVCLDRFLEMLHLIKVSETKDAKMEKRQLFQKHNYYECLIYRDFNMSKLHFTNSISI